VTGEQALNHLPLHALAATVDEPDFAKPPLLRLEQVLLDHGRDVARGEEVQVDRVFDRHDVHVALLALLIVGSHGFKRVGHRRLQVETRGPLSTDRRPRVILFDIDGTLVDCAGAGRRSMRAAFEAEVGAPHALEGVRFGGMTDRGIVREGLGRLAMEMTEALTSAILGRYLGFLRDALRESTAYRVLAGAREAVRAAHDHGSAVGLGTGNIRAGAELKLARGELASLFDFGGFGCDAELRDEVLRRGAERGARRLGVPLDACEVLIVGDTPRDIEAARAIGAACLAVATGASSMDELASAGPTYLVPTLEDPEAIAILGR
jgi:phosphoglycolate phosphatase